MRALFEIFVLELRVLVRSKTLALLTAASVLWMLAFPVLVKGDGTADGARELYVHFSLGGVFLLLVVSLLASATGSLARERQARRLQLTQVRPVRPLAIGLGKLLAHVAVGAVVLTAACLVLALKTDCTRRCNHVLSPVMPSPREEARAMYEAYMKDPETPEAVKRTKKSLVLRLLETRAFDRYQTIPTNQTVSWKFDLSPLGSDSSAPSVRMRFTNPMEMRQDVVGVFSLGGAVAAVSNITQAVLKVPLVPRSASETGFSPELAFFNGGKSALMFRPRKDLNLLVPADAFGWNLVRAGIALVALLALVVAFGLFLSAGLGRPVAIFVAFVTLIVSEMSPSVIDQYPDGLETDAIDHIGLCVTRAVTQVVRPLSAASPLEALAKDECVEVQSLVRLTLVDLVALPLLLAVLSALILPRKQNEN